MVSSRHAPGAPKPDWSHSDPEELEASIARTRENLIRHLENLKQKLAPQEKLRRIALPFAMIAAGAAIGALAWKFAGGKRQPRNSNPVVTRIRFRSAGIANHIRALRMLAGLVRSGKPGIFIVEAGKG